MPRSHQIKRPDENLRLTVDEKCINLSVETTKDETN